MRRRDFLRVTLAGGVASLAGCVSNGSQNSAGPGNTSSGQDNQPKNCPENEESGGGEPDKKTPPLTRQKALNLGSNHPDYPTEVSREYKKKIDASDLVYKDGFLYTRNLKKVKPDTGEILWSIDDETPDTHKALGDNYLYVVGEKDRVEIRKYPLNSGKRESRSKLCLDGSGIAEVEPLGDDLYITSKDNTLYKVVDGSLKWTYEGNDKDYSFYAIPSPHGIFVQDHLHIMSLNPSNGEVNWKKEDYWSPATYNDNALFVFSDGAWWRVSLEDGSKKGDINIAVRDPRVTNRFLYTSSGSLGTKVYDLDKNETVWENNDIDLENQRGANAQYYGNYNNKFISLGGGEILWKHSVDNPLVGDNREETHTPVIRGRDIWILDSKGYLYNLKES
ncbi:MAG: PQQ-binding-like beta-propeller repeat protein [Halobacteria archaeon]|nr:PQQ-binding-like beta-propeller repeat protein [Halobacteria archaeon]